jgi:hypothetical protein
MSETDLRQLERDVEAARAKLTHDLSALRSPGMYSQFTAGLKQEALDVKDTLIDKAKSSVQSTVVDLIEDLKAKAAANPTAALAIGAGIAWRLIQRPPIATALVGAGLVSLLRTTPARTNGQGNTSYLMQAKDRLQEQASEFAGGLKDEAFAVAASVKDQALAVTENVKDQATELATTAKEHVQQWSSQAKSAAERAATDAAERAATIGHKASETFDQMRHSAETGGGAVTAQVGALAKRASSAVQETISDQEARDKILLGAAGVAVVAALSIACQRRLSEKA